MSTRAGSKFRETRLAKRDSTVRSAAVRSAKRKSLGHGRTRRDSRSLSWIRDLATPYLKGYSPIAARGDGLEGYWFLAAPEKPTENGIPAGSARRTAKSAARAGFFIGYLTKSEGKYAFWHPEPPECLVFAWVNSTNRNLHSRLVAEKGSLLRKTFEYIRWLTHRPPRFVFHESQGAAMARHASMKNWPRAKYEHFSRNFFIETLAWLVRSGLVRKLREEALPAQ